MAARLSHQQQPEMIEVLLEVEPALLHRAARDWAEATRDDAGRHALGMGVDRREVARGPHWPPTLARSAWFGKGSWRPGRGRWGPGRGRWRPEWSRRRAQPDRRTVRSVTSRTRPPGDHLWRARARPPRIKPMSTTSAERPAPGERPDDRDGPPAFTSRPSAKRVRPPSRSREGKWIGGVCAGLARGPGISATWIRAAFVLGALCGGLGVLVYLACWLIIPPAGASARRRLDAGGVVALAQACAVCVGLATLGVLAAAATLFGFGWIVVVVAAGVLRLLASVAPRRPRVGAAADRGDCVAVGRDRHQRGEARAEPAATSPRRRSARTGSPRYRAGVGTMMIDLRHTALPASGVVPLRIDAGVRRTIVALAERPMRASRSTTRRTQLVLSDLGALLTGRAVSVLRGRCVRGGHAVSIKTGDVIDGGAGSYPVLMIDFSSAGREPVRARLPGHGQSRRHAGLAGIPGLSGAAPGADGGARKLRRAPMLRAWHQRLRRELQSSARSTR